MSQLFWLTDEQWAAIEPFVPRNQPGARRVDDRRVIPGIVHVLETGCRWCDCPIEYGPATTIHNRFNRRSRRRNGVVPVIPGRINRKRRIAYDRTRYRDRRLIGNAFCRIKDWRRVATRYDKPARNFLSAVAIAILVSFSI